MMRGGKREGQVSGVGDVVGGSKRKWLVNGRIQVMGISKQGGQPNASLEAENDSVR